MVVSNNIIYIYIFYITEDLEIYISISKMNECLYIYLKTYKLRSKFITTHIKFKVNAHEFKSNVFKKVFLICVTLYQRNLFTLELERSNGT